MWLFDNLFLDQNTPVTINDGLDHSHDVVTHLVDPTEDATPNQNPKKPEWVATADTPKKDDTIADLFDSDTKEEKDAQATLHPEPPKDIALEIGKAPEPLASMPPADPSMALPSFDIGGDVSFDTLPETTVTTEEAVAPTEAVPVEAPTLVLTSPSVEASGSGFLTGSPAWASVLPSDQTQSPTPNTSEASAPAPALWESVAPGGTTPLDTGLWGTWGIFGLLGSDSPAPAPVLGEAPWAPLAPTPLDTSLLGVTPAPVPDIGLGPSAPPATTAPLASIGSFWSETSLESSIGKGDTMSAESILGRDALALFRQGGQTSSLLRDKLSTFIDELKVLHSRDQSQRYHKLEQIAMYEERIREIDAEAAMRKRVLQAEIDDLKRQIEMMDREKNDIQGVISTFSKEIGS